MWLPVQATALRQPREGQPASHVNAITAYKKIETPILKAVSHKRFRNVLSKIHHRSLNSIEDCDLNITLLKSMEFCFRMQKSSSEIVCRHFDDILQIWPTLVKFDQIALNVD